MKWLPAGLAACACWVTAPAQAWDLAQAWALAQQRLPALRLVAAQTDAAKSRIDQAMAPLLPTAALDVSQAATSANFVLRPGAIPKTSSAALNVTTSPELYPFFQFAGNVRWPIYDFGRTAASVEAARQNANAASADERAAKRRLFLQVAAAYLQVLAAQSAAEVAEDAAQLTKKRRDFVKVRVDAATRPTLDLLRAESDLQAAVVQQMRAKDGIYNARLALGLAIGLDHSVHEALEPPNAPTAVLDDAQVCNPKLVDDWIGEAAAHRDEFRSQEAQIEAARAQLRSLQLLAMPTVYVAGQATYAGTDLTKLVYNYAASVGANLPLTGLWLQGPQAAELRAIIRQLQAQRDDMLLQLRGELDVARTMLVQVRRRRPPLQSLLALTEKAYEHAQIRYQAGAASMVELVDAEAARSQTKLQMVQLDLEEALAVLRWLVAMGRTVN